MSEIPTLDYLQKIIQKSFSIFQTFLFSIIICIGFLDKNELCNNSYVSKQFFNPLYKHLPYNKKKSNAYIEKMSNLLNFSLY